MLKKSFSRFFSKEAISTSMIDAIGNTPLVRLNRIPQMEGIKCEILAKCEFMNPGGSMKDRMALSMIEGAEADNILTPQKSTIVEATSGNTGISVAYISAIKGYKMEATLPEHTGSEKLSTLRNLGVNITKSRKEAGWTAPDNQYILAENIQKNIPDSFVLNQYDNPNNPLGHYLGTGKEIYEQCGESLDYVFIGVGSCGTVSGVSRRMKEEDPTIKIVGVDHDASILSLKPGEIPKQKGGKLVEGLGKDYEPGNFDRKKIDSWVSVGDKDSFDMARRMIAEEGILVGASAGSVVDGCIKWLKENNLDQKENLRCVVILPDSSNNYLTTFCSDEWMVCKGFRSPTILSIEGHPLQGIQVDLEKFDKIEKI